MITEDYVSFETANLLKEKGFDWECIGYYVDDEPDDVYHSLCGETNSTWESRCCSAPTLQMAMKFIRKAYFLNISPQFNRWENNWSVVIRSMDNRNIIKNNSALEMSGFSSYEDSVEAALQYCLKNFI